MLRFPFPTGFRQLLREQFFVGKHCVVLGGKHLVGQAVERIACDRFVGSCTKDQADWRVFARQCPVFLRVIAVHVHLPDIRMIQLGQFEIDDSETAQSSMEEEQIYTKPTVSDAQSPLPPLRT